MRDSTDRLGLNTGSFSDWLGEYRLFKQSQSLLGKFLNNSRPFITKLQSASRFLLVYSLKIWISVRFWSKMVLKWFRYVGCSQQSVYYFSPGIQTNDSSCMILHAVNFHLHCSRLPLVRSDRNRTHKRNLNLKIQKYCYLQWMSVSTTILPLTLKMSESPFPRVL